MAKARKSNPSSGISMVPTKATRVTRAAPGQTTGPSVTLLNELSDKALLHLRTNTSLEAMLRALYDGPANLAIELEHAWAPFPAWLSEMMKQYEQPPTPMPAVAPPYAVMQCQSSVPFDPNTPVDLYRIATEILTGLQSNDIHGQLKLFLEANTTQLADAFVGAVQNRFGHVIPIGFVTPTSLPAVAMQHRVAFGFEGSTGNIVIEWVACPVFAAPASPAL